jgi:hypothetical protein
VVHASGCSSDEQLFRARSPSPDASSPGGSSSDAGGSGASGAAGGPSVGGRAGSGGRRSIDGGTGAGPGIDGGGGAANGGTTGSGGFIFGNGGFSLGGAGGVLGCSAQTSPAVGLPLDVYLLVDKSGSMDQDNKWTNVSTALITFANDPAYAAVDIGLGYFPLTIPGVPQFCCEDIDCGTYGPCVGGTPGTGTCSRLFGNCQGADVCQVSGYAQPAVPFALPPSHSPVVASIQGMTPGGGTPTRPAVEGAIQYVTTWGLANPDRKQALVLATDGEPTGCTANAVQDVANIAANALNQTGLQTFVIGVGSSLTSLNQIAQSGGTGQAYLLDVAGNLPQQIADTLAAIQRGATACKYLLPTSAQAEPTRVNVTYTVSGGPRSIIPRTTDGTANCGTGPGWYFDNPAAPKMAILCPAACTVLSQVNTAVTLELGCATLIGPPP